MKRMHAVLGFVFLVTSHPLFACAVCGQGGNDPTLNAYQGSTALLSLVPLTAMGGIVFAIYKYVNRPDLEEETREED